MAQTQFDRKLKRILQKGNYLDEQKLEEAMEIANQEDKPFNEVLIERNYIDEKVLVSAVALDTNMPPIDLSRVKYEDEILDCIPQDLASYYKVVPISKLGNTLTVAIANPYDILKLDDLKISTGLDIRTVISSEKAIREAITRAYDKSAQKMEEFIGALQSEDEFDMELAGEDAEEDIDLAEISGDEKSPVIRFVNMMIFQAIKEKVSDIHIEPFEKRIRIRYRVDGVLKETTSPPKKMHNAIVARIKVMSSLDIAERRVPQDGKFQIKVEGRQVDFRVSTLPMIHGEKV
ncbi:MAG: secretion system protein E, partial [Planctomycetota bacterium]